MLLLSTSFFSYPLPRSHGQGGFEKKKVSIHKLFLSFPNKGGCSYENHRQTISEMGLIRSRIPKNTSEKIRIIRMFPKIGSFPPKIIHFTRVFRFSIINHPFWVKRPIGNWWILNSTNSPWNHWYILYGSLLCRPACCRYRAILHRMRQQGNVSINMLRRFFLPKYVPPKMVYNLAASNESHGSKVKIITEYTNSKFFIFAAAEPYVLEPTAVDQSLVWGTISNSHFCSRWEPWVWLETPIYHECTPLWNDKQKS